jgi:hypothetical protein
VWCHFCDSIQVWRWTLIHARMKRTFFILFVTHILRVIPFWMSSNFDVSIHFRYSILESGGLNSIISLNMCVIQETKGMKPEEISRGVCLSLQVSDKTMFTQTSFSL